MKQRLGALFVAVAGSVFPAAAAASEIDVPKLLQFADEMAKKGNWREAKYRWEQVASVQTDSPHILNNLAVAHEALGDAVRARPLYEKALRLSSGEAGIAENLESLERFEARMRTGPKAEPVLTERPATPRAKKGGKLQRVPISIPVPARLDLSGVESLLVASFLTPDSELFDVNREAVRFLRSEFRKHTGLVVQDINPPPAVPEQSIDEMAANSGFWKHLGAEFASDLIVSGAVRFSRKDASGFQDADVISPVTGQKVRQTVFVEQEQFAYEMDILFLDGATGQLRFRDRLRRGAVYSGLANDPITAFYDLVAGLSADVLAAVSAGKREETRVVFKK